MRVKAIRRWIVRILVQEIKVFVELHHAAGRVALRAAHHGDKEATVGECEKVIGDRRKRGIGRGQESWGRRIQYIKKNPLFLPRENAENPATGYGFSIR